MEELVHLPSLTDDLVTEILEHLPVKSLLRFKCVSKPWCNLIESPQFVDGHVRKRGKNSSNMMVMLRVWKKRNPRKEPDNNRLVLTFHDVDSPQLEVVLPNLQTPVFPENGFKGSDVPPHILGPCEGLLCIVGRGNAFVCNPALRQFKLVPPCPYLEKPCYCHLHYQSVSANHWGFGTVGNNGFMVVQLDCITRAYPDESDGGIVDKLLIQPHIYDSGTESWRQVNGSGILLPFNGKACSELSFNGNCYWHIITKGFHYRRPGIILSYEISTEIFRQFECPDILSERQLECPDKLLRESCEGSSSLMVLNECLTMVWFPHSNSLPLEVWVMKEYGIEESWTKDFVVERQTMTWPFMFWKNGESLLLEGHIDGELISYDLRTEETEKFQIHGVEVIFSAAIYKDSLISLK